jgi:hypothetical protein
MRDMTPAEIEQAAKEFFAKTANQKRQQAAS